MSLEVMTSRKLVIYSRKFTKIMDLLAGIGGVIGIFVPFFQFLYNIFQDFKYNEYILNSVSILKSRLQMKII